MDTDTTPACEGRLRISNAALDKVVMTSAYDAHGVVDVHGLLIGALLGGAVGGAIGMAQAGPVGGAVGLTLGAAAGSAAAQVLAEAHERRVFYDATARPALRIRITSRLDVPLPDVADAVRHRVRADVQALLGLELGIIDIEFVAVVPPRPIAQLTARP